MEPLVQRPSCSSRRSTDHVSRGDSITLATGAMTPVTIATTTYTAPTIGTSFNLSPDVTGTAYALHSAVTGAVGNFTPGKHANGTAF